MTDTKGDHRSVVGRAGAPGHAVRRWWRDLSVRRKYLSITLLAMVVCLLPAVLTFVFQARAADMRTTTRTTERFTNLVDDLQDAVVATDIAFKSSEFLSGAPELGEAYEAAADRIGDLVTAIEREAPAHLDRPAEELVSAAESLVVQFDTLVVAVPSASSAGPSPAMTDALDSLTGTMQEVQLSAEVLESSLGEQLASGHDELEQLEERLAWSVIICLAVALVAVVGGTSLVTSSVLRRLERVSENGQRFLRGESLLPAQRSADEIGRLTDGLEIVGELLDQRREQAVAATLAKNEFLSRVSHELRTPLTAVVGFGQILTDNPDLTSDDRDCVEHIVSGGEHMLTLINDLLDIATIEAGHIDITLEPVALRDVTGDAVALLRPLAATRSITIDSDGPDDLVVEADRRRLKQVLLNLLSNAVKYNRHAGRIDITTTARDDAVRISVADTGPGISPDGLGRLFTPFDRLDASRSNIQGTGIGLALTKNLVEAMHGTIGVESVEGQGTTFWIDLPRASDPAEPLAVTTSARGTGTTSPASGPVHRGPH